MNQQKNQEVPKPGFLEGLESEVTAETAPLLRFITKYAGVIAGCVILVLAALGGMGIWNWHKSNKQKEAREELARINMTQEGDARENALKTLAENAPDSMKFYIYMTLGQSARENGHSAVAAEAYARAAALDQGALGFAAQMAQAGSLLDKGDAREALALLQGLEKNPGSVSAALRLKEMLAEAAEQAGDLTLAIQTYQALGNELKTAEGNYFRWRAETLESQLPAAKQPG